VFFNYFAPARIMFGKGQLNHLYASSLPGRRALLVVSSGRSIRENGYLGRVEKQLDLAGVSYVVYDNVQPNPTQSNVMLGSAFANRNACDFVVALGGGSVMDAAKAIACMATNDGDLWDYVTGGSGKGKPFLNAPLPVVAITTTAGTGSEVNQWAVITREETNEKIGMGNDKVFPVIAVVDPELMLTVPPELTAYQGFDALFHATEGYISKSASPVSDLFALKAIALIGSSLARTVRNGLDEDARADVALANTLSGMLLSICRITSEHSMEHALSAFHPALPHGAGLLMLSRAYYSHFALSGVCDEKMIAMAKALGRQTDTAADFVDALVALQEDCGVADLRMSDYGIRKEALPRYVKNARETMGELFEMDPVPLSDADCLSIFERSWR
jgi:alcohol dehydrogenase